MTTSNKKASLAILFTITFLSGVFSGGVLASKAEMNHPHSTTQENSKEALTNHIKLPKGYDSLILSLFSI